MTRKSITINYKHIRKPYLTLQDKYRNKRKLKKLLQRWTIAGKITLTIAIALFSWWLINRPAPIAGAVEEQHNAIKFEKMKYREVIVEKTINDTPQKKTLAREVKKPQTEGRFVSNQAELSNIPQNQGSCFNYVPEMSKKYGVSADLMNRIIMAESGGRPLAKNTGSTASGCGQFIRGTWAGTLKQMGRQWDTPFNAELNVETMAWKISRGGIGAWNASKSKWSK